MVASGAGYWLFYPKPTQTSNYTSEGTSLEVRRTSEQTPTTSSSLTNVAPETTLWLNVTATKPVSYYVSLLKSAGAQPYVELGWELESLPDATNTTAVAKIAYLALNATNPEVKEAFQLMIKGGTPVMSDFHHTVPAYNTELEVLYWLASQTGFKKDDTLALAVALVSGFWVTIGDEQVREAVKIDVVNVLVFLRETNELQGQRGYFQLERYPLEAKLCLAWTGGDPARGGRAFYQMVRGGATSERPLNIHHLSEYTSRRMDLAGYQWNTVSVSTLRKMRETMVTEGWIAEGWNVDATVGTLEEYFYFSGFRQHWIFTQPNDNMTTYDGQETLNHNMNNPDFVFETYLKTGKAFGVCGDEASLIESLCKSWGISTIRLTRTYGTAGGNNHDHVVYYEPESQTWRCYYKQLNIGSGGTWNVYMFKPPVIQHNFFSSRKDSQQRWMNMLNVYYTTSGSGTTLAKLLRDGAPTSEMKQWLLYS